MSTCNHNCSSCSEKCSTQAGRNLEFMEPLNKFSSIKHVIGVMSGKGGVGKSSVTSMLAVHMQRLGYKVGILDSDITGPSIPKAFGIKEKALSDASLGILPAESKNNMKIMSINLMLENEDDPVIWRGPVISGVVKQFWSEVYWGDLDYLFVDMPPGTGDVTLTVFQSIPLDGVVVVTSPQGLVSLIVKKAFNMADKMNIPVLGIVENMSYVKCPDCGKEINVYGKSEIEKFAKELNIPVLAKMPLDADISRLCDEGRIEGMACNYLENAAKHIVNNKVNK
ncbi:Mrp/NBP35 family ATP-binding protein [Sedimentibacter sp. zth1]|uniref:Mrp/NBP35 family ATP-binding protein n=1 Tax=Sedimentibacter sp. zth1 TaxID=2816908 RepID=UPI001A9379FE|nr:Mrp/NBP35 family ATP-binding protein [Sedimentibacter sp. zth1]QSX07135.1 Mrp/NBP35 family ATP-binding protein [Sedimentibacter sp. zth1]